MVMHEYVRIVAFNASLSICNPYNKTVIVYKPSHSVSNTTNGPVHKVSLSLWWEETPILGITLAISSSIPVLASQLFSLTGSVSLLLPSPSIYHKNSEHQGQGAYYNALQQAILREFIAIDVLDRHTT